MMKITIQRYQAQMWLVVAVIVALVAMCGACVLECAPGELLVKRERWVEQPVYGCGSYGLTLNFTAYSLREVDACCVEHDYCYLTCGNDKYACDWLFTRCLHRLTASYEATFGWNVFKTASLFHLCIQTIYSKYRRSFLLIAILFQS